MTTDEPKVEHYLQSHPRGGLSTKNLVLSYAHVNWSYPTDRLNRAGLSSTRAPL